MSSNHCLAISPSSPVWRLIQALMDGSRLAELGSRKSWLMIRLPKAEPRGPKTQENPHTLGKPKSCKDDEIIAQRQRRVFEPTPWVSGPQFSAPPGREGLGWG